MTILNKLREATIPSLYAAAGSVGLYYFMVDSDLTRTAEILNVDVPTWVAVSLAVFTGAEIGALIDEFVIPKIPVLKEFKTEEAFILPALGAGLGTIATMMLLVSDQSNPAQAFILGTGGAVIGQVAARAY